MADDETTPATKPMTPLEDAELRQLTWFGLAGDLSDDSQGRVEALRAKDRRAGVRDPRPDPVSQDNDGRSYIRSSDPEQKPDAESEAQVRLSCSNCGYFPVADGSICPHCAVRSHVSF